MFLAIQTEIPPTQILPEVRQVIDSIDPTLPVSEVRTMEEIVDTHYTRREFYTTIIGIFSALALIMAVTGIYGVVSYHVTCRTQEFGIRIALGAQSREVLANVFQNTGRIIGFGILLGFAGIVVLSKALSSFLYETNTLNTMPLVATTFILITAGLAAALQPALRASRISPMVMLNQECLLLSCRIFHHRSTNHKNRILNL